jgi:hypothetical protein
MTSPAELPATWVPWPAQPNPNNDILRELPGTTVPPPPQDITRLITDLEQESIDAHTLKDPATHKTFLAASSTLICGRGVVDLRAEQDWQPWRSPKISKAQVLRVTEDVAIIHYRMQMLGSTWMTAAQHTTQLRSSTWVRTGNGREWKRVFHQVTPI